MKRILVLILIYCFLILAAQTNTSASANTILITEVYPSPYSTETEWLEIYNSDESEHTLVGWYLSEKTISNQCEVDTSFGEMVLGPHEYSMLAESMLKVSLNNGGDTIYLCDSNNQVIDFIEYPKTFYGISHSRESEANGEYLDTFIETSIPTPSAVNIFDIVIERILFSTDGLNYSEEIQITEDEHILISYELSNESVLVTNEILTLSDGTILSNPLNLSQVDHLLTDGYTELEFELTLELENGQFIRRTSKTVIIDLEIDIPSSIKITEVYPSPNREEVEWIEIYNYGSNEIDFAEWYFSELATEGACDVNTPLLDRILVASKEHVHVESPRGITLNNSGDTIYLCNSHNEVVDEITYPEIPKGIAFSRVYDEDIGYLSTFDFSSSPTPSELNTFLQKDGKVIETLDQDTEGVTKVSPDINNANPSVPSRSPLISYRLPNPQIYYLENVTPLQSNFKYPFWVVFCVLSIFTSGYLLYLTNPSDKLARFVASYKRDLEKYKRAGKYFKERRGPDVVPNIDTTGEFSARMN